MTTAELSRHDQLDARIRSVWTRTQAMHLLAGALALLRWAVPLFLVGVFIDWMTYMPAAGRAVILLVVLGVSLYRAWRCGWRHLRPFDAAHTALQLETHHGDLKSLLISAIQLRNQPISHGSVSLRNHTIQLAEQAAADLHPNQAVPLRPLQKPGVVAALLLGVVALFALVNGPFLAVGLARIFTPWTTAEYPTHTQISIDQDTLVVKEGDSAAITAQLTGVIPQQATIFVRTGEGKARAIDLDVLNATSTYTITSASRDFEYRIKAGDDRTAWQSVRVIPAPRIEQVRVNLAYPPYLAREKETIEALTLTVPEGTGVDWDMALDRPIRSATFVRDGQEPIELTVGEDGKTVAFTADVPASQGYHFTWVDQEQGFDFTSPRYFLQVAADQAPRVELTSPAANLVAMLGRPLTLSVRAQDDHGIATTTILYRVNQLNEQSLNLPTNVTSGQGEQPLEWDYRQALPDLQIGDTVSFTVQVSDQYPGEQGPHVVRSETRRITFLSKEQYLEQINKQRDRLLSRVQTIYRQQRGAYDVVRLLTPGADGYLQACQLEAIRQEMIRDQLTEIASQMRVLLDDLASNGVADEAQAQALDTIRLKLEAIAQERIAQAATLLREQSTQTTEVNAPSSAADAVNTAARELGSLVLLRGIESAQEVYARETRMLAQQQAALRWYTTTSTASADTRALIARQNEIAQWTDQLLDDLLAGMRYDKRPLAVLRLVRSVKDLREGRASEQMRSAAELIEKKQADQATATQAQLVKTLLNAEFSVRLSSAYSTLLQAQDQIESMLAVQQQLRTDQAAQSTAGSAERTAAIVKAQATLRKQLLTLLLPSAPAPRAGLFDETLPTPPPVDALLAEADRAMATALQHLATGDHPAAITQQGQAAKALDDLRLVVDRWSIEMGLASQGLSTLVAATSDRMSRLEEFEARVIGLLEKTDLLAADDKPVDTLLESQQGLAGDLGVFIKALKKQQQAEADPDLPPLLSRIVEAEGSLNQAAAALSQNQAKQAIGYQERAADTLAQAYAIVVAQNERLALLQGTLMFQRSVGFANGYMADIVAEQRDLLEATEAAKPDAMKALLPTFAHVRDCMQEVGPLLDLVAARLDVGTPLAFAKTDFDDAMAAIQAGDQFEAADAQDVAAESLGKVQLLVQDIRTQTGYLAEIIEHLHHSVSDLSMLAYRQDELRNALDAAAQNDLSPLMDKQQALLAQAQEQGKQLVLATGMPVFMEPVKEMQAALAALQANDAAAAIEQMEVASLVYAENAEALLAVITMLHGLPTTVINSATEPELIRLIDTLALASSHKQLFRQTQSEDASTIETIAKQQQGLASRLALVVSSGEPHPMLAAAQQQMANAVAATAPVNADALRQSQRAVDTLLRHFIIEQALILETAVPPAAASSSLEAPDGPGSDSEADVTAGFIADFVSGETPKDKRTEWKVLADRNRAALNQNFARELPLEYRGLLKNYYERVAE